MYMLSYCYIKYHLSTLQSRKFTMSLMYNYVRSMMNGTKEQEVSPSWGTWDHSAGAGSVSEPKLPTRHDVEQLC